MSAGRFFCVALPLILTMGGIISFLVAILTGVTHHNLYLFSIDISDLDNINSVDDLKQLAEDNNVDWDEIKDKFEDKFGENIENIGDNLGEFGQNLGDNIGDNIGDLGDSIGNLVNGNNKVRRQQSNNINAGDLGLDTRYEFSLWGFCSEDEDGKNRDCGKQEFDWANKQINTTVVEQLGVELPKSLKEALDLFSEVTKWTEVAFIAAIVALGVEFIVGIFSNFTRVISCLTWVIASIATALCIVAAGLATGMALIVVGAIEGSEQLYGAKAKLNSHFIALVWIGCAFAVAAGLFWIFTICCCAPEKRNRRSHRDRDSSSEKLMGQSQRGYAPLGNDHEMSGGFYNNNNTNQGYDNQYGRNPAARSDMAYEPYSHRA